jgi:hypothetical protein
MLGIEIVTQRREDEYLWTHSGRNPLCTFGMFRRQSPKATLD